MLSVSSANAQLTEHIYALDKDSVSDATFTESDFIAAAEAVNSWNQISPGADTVNVGSLRGTFSGMTLFENETTGEYSVQFPDNYHNREHERVRVPENHRWWPHLKVSREYDLTSSQKTALNAYFGTEGQSVAGATTDSHSRSASSESCSANRIGARRWRICHST